MIFIGDDWAEDHHDVYLMDEAGQRLASRRLPEGLTGIRQLHELVAAHAEEPEQAVIGIETERGLWVGALTAAGYQVYAINPLAVAHYRDRHHVSGAKSDASDAKLLADLVRTDRHNHRPSPATAGCGSDQSSRPGASELDLDTHAAHQRTAQRVARVLPGRAGGLRGPGPRRRAGGAGSGSRPSRAPTLSLTAIQSGLKRGGRQRNIAARARDIQTALRSEQLAAPATVTAAFARHHPRRRGHHRRAEPPNQRPRGRDWPPILRHTRTPTSTSPSQDSVSSSAPGCSVSSGTTRTDTPAPSLAKTTPERHR